MIFGAGDYQDGLKRRLETYVVAYGPEMARVLELIAATPSLAGDVRDHAGRACIFLRMLERAIERQRIIKNRIFPDGGS